jgi:hypothetical protein
MPIIDVIQERGDKAIACFPALAVAFLLAQETVGELDD